MTPLEKLDNLSAKECRTFLALCAARQRNAQATRDADGRERLPDFGKAECGWVDDWRDYYGRLLLEIGFAILTESEPRPALGMAPGGVCWDVDVQITEAGWQAREDWWDRLNRRSANSEQEQAG